MMTKVFCAVALSLLLASPAFACDPDPAKGELMFYLGVGAYVKGPSTIVIPDKPRDLVITVKDGVNFDGATSPVAFYHKPAPVGPQHPGR